MRIGKIYNRLVAIITRRYIISYLQHSQALFRLCFKVLPFCGSLFRQSCSAREPPENNDPTNEQSGCVFPLTAGCQSVMIFGIEVPSLKIKVMPEKVFIENI